MVLLPKVVMKSGFPTVAALGAGLLLALSGCGSKQDAASELDKAAAALKEVPAAEAPPAPAAPAQPIQPAPTAPAVAAPPPATEMSQAITAFKGGKLEDAVTRLQRLRAAPALTPQQRIALNDAMAAVMTEIYGLAAKGDPRAVQAVKQYEAMQTGRR